MRLRIRLQPYAIWNEVTIPSSVSFLLLADVFQLEVLLRGRLAASLLKSGQEFKAVGGFVGLSGWGSGCTDARAEGWTDVGRRQVEDCRDVADELEGEVGIEDAQLIRKTEVNVERHRLVTSYAVQCNNGDSCSSF